MSEKVVPAPLLIRVHVSRMDITKLIEGKSIRRDTGMRLASILPVHLEIQVKEGS